jgi:polyhydroxyalkanoate synthesis repressor PhaR
MEPAPDNDVVQIKKYPNRRYYNIGHGRHETLTELYNMVRAGKQIRVTDSKTGQDITNVVLTQIILEHDPPKLDLFPATLLHQAIQANQQMVRRFVEQYFAQAVEAFGQSRIAFEEFLKKSGFSALAPTAPFDWVRMLFPGMGGANVPGSAPPSAASDSHSVAALKEQVANLSDELARLRAESSASPGRGRRKRT